MHALLPFASCRRRALPTPSPRSYLYAPFTQANQPSGPQFTALPSEQQLLLARRWHAPLSGLLARGIGLPALARPVQTLQPVDGQAGRALPAHLPAPARQRRPWQPVGGGGRRRRPVSCELLRGGGAAMRAVTGQLAAPPGGAAGQLERRGWAARGEPRGELQAADNPL